MKLAENMRLFHGGYAAIERIDLERCAPGKDFGKGFYLTSDADQARRFIPSSLRKARAQSLVAPDQCFGFVTEFEFHQPESPVTVYEFGDADRNWLRFVAMNRRSSLARRFSSMVEPALLNADIVIGKVADDATNPTITAYLTGLFGPVDDDKTIDAVIERLMPHKLTDQYCFATPAALKCLRKMGTSRYEP